LSTIPQQQPLALRQRGHPVARRVTLPLVGISAIALEAFATRRSTLGEPIALRSLVLVSLALAPVVIVLLPGLAALVAARRHLNRPAQRLGVVLAGCGTAGMVTFWAYFLGPQIGKATAVTVLILSLGTLSSPHAWETVTDADVSFPLALALGAAVFYSGAAFVDGGLAAPMTAMFHRFWIVLDNAIPEVFAEHLVDGRSVHGFVMADWHFSDRPPLQTGMLLPLYWLFGNREVGYQFGAIAIESLFTVAIWALLRSLAVGIRRCALVVAAVIPSGVLFFNSVYVWPKLIAATLVVTAFAIVIDGATRSHFVRPVLVAVLAVLAMLSHGSSVYPLLALAPFAVAFVYRRCRWSLGLLLALVAAVLLLYAPWSAFQHFEDPPGNRLVKWHLADAYQVVDNRSIPGAVIDAYSHATIGEIVVNKLENFGTVIWRPDYAKVAATPGWLGDPWGKARIIQIELLLPATLPLALVYLALLARRGRSRARDLHLTGSWVAASIAIWCLLQYGGVTASRTVLHNGSLAPVLCILACGALLARRLSRSLFVLVFAAQAATFLLIWVVTVHGHPALPGAVDVARFEPASLAALGFGAVIVLGVIVLAGRLDRGSHDSDDDIQPARSAQL
jgi:hypothetical protein